MSGRLDVPPPSFINTEVTESPWWAASTTSRLMLSLGCSCLLHAVTLGLPLFGTGSRFAQQVLQGGQMTPVSLSVTLQRPQAAGDKLRHLPAESAATLNPPEPEAARKAPQKPAERRPDEFVLPFPGVAYFPASALDVRPQLLTEFKLDLSGIAHVANSGKVILTLWVSPSGEPFRVSAEATDLPQDFVSIALAAFEQMRFKPGERGGEPVGTLMKVEVDYNDGRVRTREAPP
jgi:hypothetical protein